MTILTVTQTYIATWIIYMTLQNPTKSTKYSMVHVTHAKMTRNDTFGQHSQKPSLDFEVNSLYKVFEFN